MQVGDIADIIRRNGGNKLENIKMFDVYRGKQIEDGKKSVAFALSYRDSEKTLTDDRIASDHTKILNALETELGATLREV